MRVVRVLFTRRCLSQAWRSNLATAIPRWWTPRARNTTAVADRNAETAPAIVTAIRPRNSLVAARKVSGKKNFRSLSDQPTLIHT